MTNLKKSSTRNPKTQSASEDIFYKSCIGVDVHLKNLVCCHHYYNEATKAVTKQTKEFKTTKSGLLEFGNWCKELFPELVIMESTGPLWRSPFETLEGLKFDSRLALVNARDVKGLKGHKTDLNDADHLARIGRLGAFRKSFVPEKTIRFARETGRAYRKAKCTYASKKNRLQKLLNAHGLRTVFAFSDISGKTAKKILHSVLYEDWETVETTVQNNSSRLKATPEEILDALCPIWDERVKKLLRNLYEDIQREEQNCEKLYDLLKWQLEAHRKSVELLMSITGVEEMTAYLAISEIGSDLSSFSSAEKFCSWIGICPGNNISAGKSYSSRTTKGNKYLRQTLVECATSIARMSKQKPYMWQKFQVLKETRGRNRAVVAIAHKLARIMFAILTNKVRYTENPEEILRHKRTKDLNRSIVQARKFDITFDGNNSIVDIKTGDVLMETGRSFSFSRDIPKKRKKVDVNQSFNVFYPGDFGKDKAKQR